MTSDQGNEALRDLIAQASSATPVAAAELALTPSVAFRSGARWFAVPAASVREVVALEAITPVPGSNEYVLGVAMVRGRLVPVVDVCRRLDIPRTGGVAATRPRLVVISQDEEEVAVPAEETRGVLQLSMPRAAGELVQGEVRWEGGLVIVLAPEHVVAILGGER